MTRSFCRVMSCYRNRVRPGLTLDFRWSASMISPIQRRGMYTGGSDEIIICLLTADLCSSCSSKERGSLSIR